MTSKWQALNTPPVLAAIFQLQFSMGSTSLDDFLKFDSILRRDFPFRNNQIEADINISGATGIPLGKSPITSGYTEARMKSYAYFTKDQKAKLIISNGEITYTSERIYEGWDTFKANIKKYLKTFEPILGKLTITRTSIRFINQFTFTEFNDPSAYFNTVISSNTENGQQPYPLIKYGFRLTLDISDGVYSIVNHNADKTSDKYIYIFDIDVLNRNNLIFDIDSIDNVLEDLREIKNNIFFSSVTEKAIETCK